MENSISTSVKFTRLYESVHNLEILVVYQYHLQIKLHLLIVIMTI